MSLRRRLSEVIRDLHLVMIGPIRQEILSGLSDERKYEDLKQKISVFSDYSISTHDTAVLLISTIFFD